jgi:hypothetical protein
MNHRKARIIMGSAIGLAAIAVAIDHTRHKLPTSEAPGASQPKNGVSEDSPCGMDSESPCSTDENPCGVD